MISILISVYNTDPSQLVRDLASQLERSDLPGEIIVGNDYSESTFMPLFQKLEEIKLVRVFHSPQNLGRSKIRNKLSELASFENLLFIDGDAEVKSSNFIRKYVDIIGTGEVICGGTAYCERSEVKENEILRWKYGVKREVVSAEKRNINPYNSFSSFNFLISASVFKRLKFNEEILKYGHEDTIFGLDLMINNVSLIHIDNQLIHNGLDSSYVFLEKTREGIVNLIDLLESHPDSGLLVKNIRLINRYNRNRKIGIRFILRTINALAWKSIIKNLHSTRPSIYLLDVYKLILLNDNQP